MKLTEILALTTRIRGARAAKAENAWDAAVPETTYRRKTRRHGGVTFVGTPNKIAKRMGA